MSTTYTVTAERGSGPVWVLECAEVGAVSQTKRLDHAADEMREAIAYQAGINPDEVNIIVEPVLPAHISELKDRAEQQRTQADKARTKAAESSRTLAKEMKNQGFTTRDMGVILGISYQRAAALAAG